MLRIQTLLCSLITKANERITQDYVVAIGENKAGPDVILKTTNATIKSCVYLQGNVPRTAEVTVETTNASIATMFPDKQAGQAVLFNVRTTNSKIRPQSLCFIPAADLLFARRRQS